MRIHYFFLFFFLCACSSPSNETVPKTAVESVEFANFFTVEDKKLSYKVTILSPKDRTVEKSIEISKNKDSVRIVALSATHIGMISVLNATDAIVGVSNGSYIHNTSVQKNWKNGKIIELGEESNIPLEELIAIQPDYIIYSGFGKSFPHEKQLEQLGIVCIQNYDWRETHPLGKAEWVKLFGVLLRKVKEANSYFDAIAKQYNRLKTAPDSSNCSVMSGNIWGDTWSTPAGESYNAQLLQDAGFNYFYAKTEGTGSLLITLEQTLRENKNAEIWVNPGHATSSSLLQSNSKAKFFKAFQDQQVFTYSHNRNLFWEMSIIQPDILLRDLQLIQSQPQNFEDSLYFYQRIAE